MIIDKECFLSGTSHHMGDDPMLPAMLSAIRDEVLRRRRND
jgi:hypothetical protein